ncbi:hypothetical protein PYCC9005_003408 [Savitreella phatthalungensis]
MVQIVNLAAIALAWSVSEAAALPAAVGAVAGDGTAAIVSASNGNKTAAATPVVAAADTPREIVDLGIVPQVLKVKIKANPHYTPNVANAINAVNAKYLVVATPPADHQLEKRGRVFNTNPATTTTAGGRSFNTQPAAAGGTTGGGLGTGGVAASVPAYCKYFPMLSICQVKPATTTTSSSTSVKTTSSTKSSSSSILKLTSSSTTTTTTSSRPATTTTTTSSRPATTSTLPSSSSSLNTPNVLSTLSSVRPTTSSLVLGTTTSSQGQSSTLLSSSRTSSSAATTTSSVPLILQADNIQLDSEFLSEVTIGSNNNQLSLLLDTGSSDLWMFNTDCPSCINSGHDLYNPSKSTTFKNTTTTFSLLYGDGSQTSGYVGYDTVNVAGAPIQAQSLDVAHVVSPNLMSNPMDGILGLGFRSLSTQNAATPVDNMVAQKIIPKGVFGLQFVKDNQWQNSGGGGQWTFGGYDSSVVSGPLTNVPLRYPQYWQVNMDSVSVGTAGSWTPSQPVIIDSGTTLIMLDPTMARNIHQNLPGARVSTDPSSGSQHYQIFCNATSNAYAGNRNVYFSLGGTKYAVPVRDLAWYPEGNGYCYSGIQAWNNNFGILGIMFLKNVYVVFDQDNTRVQIAKRTDVTYYAD